MPSDCADGMDFFDVYEKAGRAIERARAGEGPTLLECKTYRFMGHYVGDNLAYRSKEESDHWKQNRDPIQKMASELISRSICTQEDIDRLNSGVDASIDEAVEAAQNAPFPTPEDVLTDVYAED